MAGLYHAKAVQALARLKAKGGKGQFTIFTKTTDPIAQTTTSVPQSCDFWAVGNSTSRTNYRAQQYFGATALVERKITYITVAALGLPRMPTIGDEMTWQGLTWRVIRGDPVDPAGDEPILYDVFIER